jgi:hypothetical protein
MLDSLIIDQVLEDGGWAQRLRDQGSARWKLESQILAEKLQKSEAELRKVEAERQKSEAERRKVEAERAAERRKVEAERRKVEAEREAEREKVLFLEQALREQTAQHRAE